MIRLAPCRVSALRPGDIGIYYAPPKPRRHRTLKQWLIGLGQSYARVTHPDTGGDSRMLHAYVVLQVFPVLGRVRIADAARDDRGRCGVGQTHYDFLRRGPDRPGGMHLFYRFKDARLAHGVAMRAEAWSARPVANFSSSRAAMAPFRCWALFGGARRHIRHLVAHPPTSARCLPGLHGHRPYPLMCSNFVSSVCVPEVLALYCRERGMATRVTRTTLKALKVGSAGGVFNSDPRWMLPSTLQAMLAGSSSTYAVGSICGE